MGTRQTDVFRVISIALVIVVLLPPNKSTSLTDDESAPAKRKTDAAVRRVLIVTGVDYPGHKWRETTPVLVRAIKAHERLEVQVTERPELLASEKLHEYDVVLLHFMNWKRPDPGEKARKNLKKFVENGKGLVLVHFACGAFQEWPEFANLAGRVWDPKLRGHDPRGPFRVTLTPDGKKHEATRGLVDFDTDDELYTCLRGKRPIQVLANAKSRVDGKEYPMAFAFAYGKGRVFSSPLGHDARALRTPAVGELFRRGCAWAARLPLTNDGKRPNSESPESSKSLPSPSTGCVSPRPSTVDAARTRTNA